MKIRGQDYSLLSRGPLLTNERIDYYRRQGRYGTREQRLALDEHKQALAKKKAERAAKSKKSGSSRERNIMANLQSLLDD